MTTTRVVRRIRAPREKVYRALLAADAVSRWLHPDGVSCITLADAPGGTELTWLHENVPPGVKPEDNELGTRMTLDNLAALVEGSERGWPEPRGRAR